MQKYNQSNHSQIDSEETDVSREIRILAEVEKIWIMFELDKDSKLQIDDIKDYVHAMTVQRIELTGEQIMELCKAIDTDHDGMIDKQEMQLFLRAMMILQKDLSFKTSDAWKRLQDKKKFESTKRIEPITAEMNGLDREIALIESEYAMPQAIVNPLAAGSKIRR